MFVIYARDAKNIGEMVDQAFNAMCQGRATRLWLYYLPSATESAGEIALADGYDSIDSAYKVADTLPVCTGGKTKEQMRATIFELMRKLPILGPRTA